ncbi:stress protection protein MarC [Serratia sp. OLHL2]|uniref:UPF0056 membrane protein n=1 Tax=Serratia marcescens TaxID=615 RepID=A0AAP8PUX9_SERMA|nr:MULTISPECIES: MarC family NAAT transporter [Serratia]KMJ15444.1 MarC family membrane protein [Serratia marcescens]MBH2562138.1 MarC family NAAT transporter [Serratia ureilytica]MBH2646945.1 MarC family NAAT transporter [Serratia marcescens]MBH2661376.1 MarC family NAAT transporter [Serratia ureilytica]MBH2665740.1 MarC family NAAT transporter [Serratia ureilytica]
MFELFKLIGLGLVLLLPLVNPLTTVALFLGLSGDMSEQEKKKQSAMAAFYVFVIMMVAWYAGKAVINTFGISIPGLRIAGGMIVAFIGFNMLFPQDVNKPQSGEKGKTKNIAFIPLAMPSTAGPGTIAMLISAASTFSAETSHLDLWVAYTAPPLIAIAISLILWVSLRASLGVMKLVGTSGIDAISRVMGFLLVCMGVQFVINGVVELVTMQ